MRHHIERYCKFYQGNRSKKQKVLVGDKSKGNNLVAVGFSQESVLEACVKMVVIDEMPFSTVDKMGFRLFCAVGIPLFKVPSRRTLVRTFLNMSHESKAYLKKTLSAHRICLTTDTWTSTQNTNYMVLTSHFIDHEWNMHKRIINFCVIPNHYGTTIAKLIESCLLEWGIDKVMTITVDNASANKVALDQLMTKMNRWENSQAILGGKYLHVRCIAHITNIIVSHGMKRLNNGLLAIRNCVRFVRSSPQRLELFRQAVNRVKLTCKATVCLDCPTRWNSTFVMLDVALKFKKAFATMAEDEASPFLAYFKEVEDEKDEDGVIIVCQTKGRKRVGPPTEEDWSKAEVFVKFLRVFYDVTLRVSASTHPTVHTGLHDVIKVETAINNLESRANMQVGLLSEQLLKAMASDMRSKYEKYFDSYHELNPLIVIGLVLDPRFKLRHVTQLFRKKLSDIEAQLKTEEIKNILRALYDEYVPNVEGGKYMKKSESLQSQPSSTSSNVAMTEDDLIDEWMHFVEDSDEKVVGDDVDSYLFDPLVQITKEESTKYFNILLWWKVNGNKYPILAAIAKDILAIQVSTVASESAFSTGGRVISDFRSSLTPKSVEALICMQNWLRGDNIITLEDDAPSIDYIEFYESIESELAKSTSSIASLTLDQEPQQAPKQSEGSNSQEPPLMRLQSARSSQAQRPPKPSKNKCPKGKGKVKV
ncbi:zinc finger BED domain-containing protein RICESLEEPER 2-like [Malus domestica]|uniref:zinc finger BED domain-containing protein RICESLEEPER 2-like n=1 Tax=Malus domestica TaxID=3750 RepID=UPI003976A816